MIRNQNGATANLICDMCGHAESFTGRVDGFDGFSLAVAFKKDKSNGWTCKKTKEGFEDYCPECVAAIRSYNRQRKLEADHG